MPSKAIALGLGIIARRALIFAILLVASKAVFAEEPLNRNEIKAKIEAAWNAREAESQSVTIKYRCRLKQGNPPTESVDPESSLYVLGEGGRYRHEAYLLRGIGEQSGQHRFAFDGAIESTFTPATFPLFPSGRIGVRSRYAPLPADFDVSAIVYQPRSRLFVEADKFVVNPGIQTIADRRCVRARYAGSNQLSGMFGGALDVLLDVERDFLPVRMEFISGATKWQQIDIEYEQQEDRWAIRQWKVSVFLDRNASVVSIQDVPYMISQFDVESCTFNAAVDESLFRLKFPPGTRVDDEIGRRLYIVNEDGGMSSGHEHGFPAPSERAWPRRPWAIAVFSLALGISALFAYRHSRVD